MLLLKYLMLFTALGTLAAAAAMMLYHLYLNASYQLQRSRGAAEGIPTPQPIPIRYLGKLIGLAILPLLVGLSITVIPSGMAGVRVSQISGTRPGTLYPGVHLIKPFLEWVAMYDVRDRVFSTEAIPTARRKAEVLIVQAREGLPIGLAVTVRFRLDARRLDFIQANLPQPVEEELVPPVTASVFRELVPNYTVRDVFATRREEIRQRAFDAITRKLGADGIVVKEIMVRDIKLPDEYARGLEGLLLKEQENDRLGVETEIKQKGVRIAELEAEAEKVQEVKRAEGNAQVRVLQAKGESDAMQYTLPLKEKQIQQSRLEAEARKESTVKTAEASAQAKVIDSKAELEKRKLMAEAEANRIRLTASANAERLKSEAIVLRQNPLLINKIIAEKLSDKVQIMMVPSDGKFFLTNDLLHGAPMPTSASQPADDDDSSGPGR